MCAALAVGVAFVIIRLNRGPIVLAAAIGEMALALYAQLAATDCFVPSAVREAKSFAAFNEAVAFIVVAFGSRPNHIFCSCNNGKKPVCQGHGAVMNK